MITRAGFAAMLDPGRIMRAAGILPDRWQKLMLFCIARLILVNCSRQVGKSTTVAAKALHQCLTPGSLVLIVSPSERQSKELFRKVKHFIKKSGLLKSRKPLALEAEFENGSRIVALPGSEDTVRGFSAVDLIIVDEAAYVPEGVYRAVRPMLAVSGGQLVALTTPKGKRGFFYEAWVDEALDAERITITHKDCPRIPADFLDQERRALGPFFAQEYEAVFLDLVGMVFPAALVERAFKAGVDLEALGIEAEPVKTDECEELVI